MVSVGSDAGCRHLPKFGGSKLVTRVDRVVGDQVSPCLLVPFLTDCGHVTRVGRIRNKPEQKSLGLPTALVGLTAPPDWLELLLLELLGLRGARSGNGSCQACLFGFFPHQLSVRVHL